MSRASIDDLVAYRKWLLSHGEIEEAKRYADIISKRRRSSSRPRWDPNERPDVPARIDSARSLVYAGAVVSGAVIVVTGASAIWQWWNKKLTSQRRPATPE